MRILLLSYILFLGSLQSIAEPYTTFTENGKVGLKNEAGVIVIPAKYEALGWSNGSFSVTGKVIGYKLKGSWGVLSLSNQRVTPPDYSSLTPGEGQLLVASKQTAAFKISTGCISTEGKVIIPFSYLGVKVHSLRAVAFIREGNLFKHGLIDLENKILIPFQYRNIYPIGSLRYAVEDFNGKTALFSEGGKQISGFTIDSISHFNNNVAIIYETGRQGLITREGELRSEAKYREIRFDQKTVNVRLPDEWSVLDAQNKLSEVIYADSVIFLGASRYKIEDAGTSKLVGKNLKPIINETFTELKSFENNLAIYKQGSQYGVVKRDGKILLAPLFRKIRLFDHYMLTLEKSDKISWSLRDTLGQRKNSRSYDFIQQKQGTVFPVVKNGYWGAINEEGLEIIACVYDSILECNNNQLAVKFKGQYGIISLKEQWLAYPQPHKLQLINQDRYFKKNGNTLFLCSFTGTILYFTINPIEVKENYFIESVSTGGTWTINFDGRIINRQLPPLETTEEIFPSTEGLRGIKKNGRYGFIDDQGRLRIANRYENIKPFAEGLAAIKIRNKWGFINRDEQIIIQPAYEEVSPFEKGYAVVKQKGLYGLLNHQGKLVLLARYNAVQILGNGRLLLTLNGLQGLADQHGNVLLHPKYNSITDLDNGYVVIRQDEKFGLVTIQGMSTIPQVYDQLTFDKERNLYLALKKSAWTTFE